MSRNARLLAPVVFVAVSILAVGCDPRAMDPSPAPTSEGRYPVEVEPPCAGAELHQSTTYDKCSGGRIDRRETDMWCCPNGTMQETDSLLEATGGTCEGGTIAVSTCASHDIQRLDKCTNDDRTDAARKCDNAGCHYDITYDKNGIGCTVSCID